MASLQKNVASQNFTFVMVSTTTGLGLAGLTITGFVTKDGGAQAATAGTFTSLGNGQYNYAPTQAETNATDVGFLMTNASAITTNIDFHTDLTDATGNLQVDVVRINNVVAATPGAAGGILIAGTNAATTISGLTLTGAAAVTSTPATAGLTVTGGAASTTSGGTSAAGIIVTGGAGAASTNGAAAGATFTAGGTTTVSGNDGTVMTGTGNGNGLTTAHAGTGKDFNATTSGPLQVNATQINGVATTPVTTINANQGTTQPINFTGTAGSALVQCDVRDWLGTVVATPATAGIPDVNVKNVGNAAVGTTTAQIGVNVVNIGGHAATLDTNNFLQVDVEAINALTIAAQQVAKANASIGRGTCAAGGTTTSIPTSAWTPGGAGVVTGQFIGRTIVFDWNTATAALQGQATNITANTSGATPTFTGTALTTAPASGDTFGVY